MSQDTVDFPWRSPFEDEKITLQATPIVTKKASWKTWIETHRIVIGLVIAIATLILILENKKVEQVPTPHQGLHQISIMVPVIPFAKGSTIQARLLKPVIAPVKSFTKTQLLSVFTEEDIERIDGQVIAKKDLAPYRPIFWPSLELKPQIKNPKPQVQILYPTGATP